MGERANEIAYRLLLPTNHSLSLAKPVKLTGGLCAKVLSRRSKPSAAAVARKRRRRRKMRKERLCGPTYAQEYIYV
jgi:hypothetical protein